MENLNIPNEFMRGFGEQTSTWSREQLLEKFNTLIDRVEEISNWEEFKEYKSKISDCINKGLDFDTTMKECQELQDKINSKIEFGNKLDDTAFMIALSGFELIF